MILPLCIPLYDRPEFLAETVRTLNAAEVPPWLQVQVQGWMDYHEDPAVREQVSDEFNKLQFPKTLHEYARPVGGSANNAIGLMSTATAWKTDYVVYLESDMIVCKGFFQFMANAVRTASNYSNVMQVSTGHYDIEYDPRDRIVAAQWPSSMGALCFTSRMQFFREQLLNYLFNPEHTAAKHLNLVPEKFLHQLWPDGNWFNTRWGGLLALNLAVQDLYVWHPTVPRSCHIGWHGWNLERSHQEAAGITSWQTHGQAATGFSEDFDH